MKQIFLLSSFLAAIPRRAENGINKYVCNEIRYPPPEHIKLFRGMSNEQENGWDGMGIYKHSSKNERLLWSKQAFSPFRVWCVEKSNVAIEGCSGMLFPLNQIPFSFGIRKFEYVTWGKVEMSYKCAMRLQRTRILNISVRVRVHVSRSPTNQINVRSAG